MLLGPGVRNGQEILQKQRLRSPEQDTSWKAEPGAFFGASSSPQVWTIPINDFR